MQQHIWLDEQGKAWVDDTNTKVIEIVEDVLAYGWSPEEIHFQHPYLSLGQIHSALAYYWDNADEIDRDIKERIARVEEIRSHIAKVC